mmetsp:Transcript_14153/g.27968  ORF Transcript_14153/g.27968 Transcript_14153/m.27968 type:complete len:232 (+) Transcript_14153:407-1102(+)
MSMVLHAPSMSMSIPAVPAVSPALMVPPGPPERSAPRAARDPPDTKALADLVALWVCGAALVPRAPREPRGAPASRASVAPPARSARRALRGPWAHAGCLERPVPLVQTARRALQVPLAVTAVLGLPARLALAVDRASPARMARMERRALRALPDRRASLGAAGRWAMSASRALGVLARLCPRLFSSSEAGLRAGAGPRTCCARRWGSRITSEASARSCALGARHRLASSS